MKFVAKKIAGFAILLPKFHLWSELMRALFACRYVRICLLLIALSGACLGLGLWRNRNDGFTIERIESTLPYTLSWEIPKNPEKIHSANLILNQPFHYLSHGFQFYAFVSADGKYVLKFLRKQRLCPPVLYDFLPSLPFIKDLKEKKTQERAKRAELLFRSIKVAYENVSEQTGLLYVHLAKTTKEHPSVVLTDKLQNKYTVALDNTEFVLQYRADLIKPTLRALMEAGQIKKARERISQIFTMLLACAKKGVIDTDGALIHKNNIGFLKDSAIYIDIGKLQLKDTIKTKQRFEYDLRRLRALYKWLSAKYPPLAAYFKKEQARALAEF